MNFRTCLKMNSEVNFKTIIYAKAQHSKWINTLTGFTVNNWKVTGSL